MKGIFTHGASLLLAEEIPVADLKPLLSEFGPIYDKSRSNHWAIGGPSIVLPIREEVNGYLAIDVVARQWPDHMGDPKQEPELFAAWTMGHFGPFAFPGSLHRAIQQAWHWRDASAVVPEHQAFARLKVSYCFGAESSAPVVPKDYDAGVEVAEVLSRIEPLMKHDACLCYFNPSGETVFSEEGLSESLEWSRKADLPPLEVFSNVRSFNIGGNPRPWSVMDTVGMWQVEVPDHEAGFETDQYDAGEVSIFLRNASLYVLQNGEVIKDGDTMDGPGSIRWSAKSFESSLLEPPRRTLRWLPEDGSARPEALTRDHGAEPDAG